MALMSVSRDDGAISTVMGLARTLLKSVPVPIFFKDHEGKYLGCNPAFEKFFGRQEAEIVGKDVY